MSHPAHDPRATWTANANAWIDTLDQAAIPSRRITSPAIVETVAAYAPATAIDVGCGEGWLTRALTARGIRASGIDAIPGLIDNARQKGPEPYAVLSYEDIIAGHALPDAPYDAIIFNYSLFEAESTEHLLAALRSTLSAGPLLHQRPKHKSASPASLLTPHSSLLFLQTVHPFHLTTDERPYASRWEDDAFRGLPGRFSSGHAWYARTFGDWVSLLNRAGYRLVEVREPVWPDTGKPVSLILVATGST